MEYIIIVVVLVTYALYWLFKGSYATSPVEVKKETKTPSLDELNEVARKKHEERVKELNIEGENWVSQQTDKYKVLVTTTNGAKHETPEFSAEFEVQTYHSSGSSYYKTPDSYYELLLKLTAKGNAEQFINNARNYGTVQIGDLQILLSSVESFEVIKV